MLFFWAFSAAVGCAVCNGIAAILQKVGADKEQKAVSAHPGILWQLRKNIAYLGGIALDLIAAGLTLIAVHNLPLFLVQPVIASAVMITALIDHFVLKQHLPLRSRLAIAVLLSGLFMLGIAAAPEKASLLDGVARWSIISLPLLLVVAGSSLAKITDRRTAPALAAISGLAFGGASIVGRAIPIPHPFFAVVHEPLAWSLLAYGFVGILFFTIALQRASATTINAVMIACETLFAVIIGFVFLGDRPRHNLWAEVIVGLCLAFAGTMIIATTSEVN